MTVTSACYVALVHHPVLSRQGTILTTAVTNIDIHDIARSVKTFGVAGYFVVTPIDAQRMIVDRILEHWRLGEGQLRLPERGAALARVRPVASLEDAIAAIAAEHGVRPKVVATSAQVDGGGRCSFPELRERIRGDSGAKTPHLIVLGTGHGLAPAILEAADAVLEPIRGVDGYNHLSVRAAAAIMLDRLMS